MEKHEWLAEAFEAERSHLQAVAYRLLGSLSEADDAVKENGHTLVQLVEKLISLVFQQAVREEIYTAPRMHLIRALVVICKISESSTAAFG